MVHTFRRDMAHFNVHRFVAYNVIFNFKFILTAMREVLVFDKAARGALRLALLAARRGGIDCRRRRVRPVRVRIAAALHRAVQQHRGEEERQLKRIDRIDTAATPSI